MLIGSSSNSDRNYQLVCGTFCHSSFSNDIWGSDVAEAVMFSSPQFDQDGGTARGTINMIYSCHCGCCGYPTFNALTSVKAVWIPTPSPLTLVVVCTYTKVHVWKHTEAIFSLKSTKHTHTRDCSVKAAQLSLGQGACVTHFIWHIHRSAWVKSTALKFKLNSFAPKQGNKSLSIANQNDAHCLHLLQLGECVGWMSYGYGGRRGVTNPIQQSYHCACWLWHLKLSLKLFLVSRSDCSFSLPF